MKKLIFIITLLITSQSFGQFDVGVYQDIKLATKSDDYGNTPFTTDAIVKITYTDSRNVTLSINYEFADLSEQYHRLSLGIGYHLKYKRFSSIVELETMGAIWRPNFNDFSFGATSNIMYNLDKIDVGFLAQLLDRSDINKKRLSYFFGIKYNL